MWREVDRQTVKPAQANIRRYSANTVRRCSPAQQHQPLVVMGCGGLPNPFTAHQSAEQRCCSVNDERGKRP